jgi:hypothetical protein
MHLIQIFLPVRDEQGHPFPAAHYLDVRQALTQKFGGMTAFTRAPAEGLWKSNENTVTKDDMVIFEVMLKTLDKQWWRHYKKMLEEMFSQDALIIRIQDIELI